jgi:hypothetical protein
MMVTIVPVFRYWTVVLDANPVVVPETIPPVPVEIGVDTEPVGIGSSLPICIRAGRLSVASTLGEERIFARESVCRAVINAWTALVRPAMPLIPVPNAVFPVPPVGAAGSIPLLIAP